MFLKLVKVEIEKILKRKYLFFIIFFVFLTCFLSVYFYSEKYKEKNYQLFNFTQEQINDKNYQDIIEENKILFEKYQKEEYTNLSKESLSLSYTIIMFLSLIIVIISGSNISGEVNKKTINMLLTRAIKKRTIFFGKYFSLFSITLILSILLLIIMFITTGVINNFSDLFTNTFSVVNKKIVEIPFLVLFLKNYFILLIPILFIMTLAFCLSTLSLNTSLSVGISIFLLIFSPSLATTLLTFDINFLEYTIFPYLDFSIFLDNINISLFNIENNLNLSILKGSIILLVTGVVLLIITNFVFVRKDIKS